MFIPFTSFASVFEQDLYSGLVNKDDVKRLQEFLRYQGIYTGPVTGNFFSLTQDGVKKFQEREGIVPAAGFFGPKTRARANELAKPLSREEEIIFLQERIKLLQEQLKGLQEKLAEEQASSTTTVNMAKDTTPPVFTKRPYILKKEFISSPMPLGARYPYRIVLDWAVDESVEELLECSPQLKLVKSVGKSTEYYLKAHTSYTCTVSAKDSEGNVSTDKLEFRSPDWVSIDGFRKVPFPATRTTPLKIGDISVYNGTTTDILFAQLTVRVVDNMNATLNRNRDVYLVLRDGTTTSDTTLGKTKFTLHPDDPKPDKPNTYLVDLSIPVVIKAGEEKTFGLWIEDLEYVISGSLVFEFYKLTATETIDPEGGFNLQQGGAILFSLKKSSSLPPPINFIGGFNIIFTK